MNRTNPPFENWENPVIESASCGNRCLINPLHDSAVPSSSLA